MNDRFVPVWSGCVALLALGYGFAGHRLQTKAAAVRQIVIAEEANRQRQLAAAGDLGKTGEALIQAVDEVAKGAQQWKIHDDRLRRLDELAERLLRPAADKMKEEAEGHFEKARVELLDWAKGQSELNPGEVVKRARRFFELAGRQTFRPNLGESRRAWATDPKMTDATLEELLAKEIRMELERSSALLADLAKEELRSSKQYLLAGAKLKQLDDALDKGAPSERIAAAVRRLRSNLDGWLKAQKSIEPREHDSALKRFDEAATGVEIESIKNQWSREIEALRTRLIEAKDESQRDGVFRDAGVAVGKIDAAANAEAERVLGPAVEDIKKGLSGTPLGRALVLIIATEDIEADPAWSAQLFQTRGDSKGRFGRSSFRIVGRKSLTPYDPGAALTAPSEDRFDRADVFTAFDRALTVRHDLLGNGSLSRTVATAILWPSKESPNSEKARLRRNDKPGLAYPGDGGRLHVLWLGGEKNPEDGYSWLKTYFRDDDRTQTVWLVPKGEANTLSRKLKMALGEGVEK